MGKHFPASSARFVGRYAEDDAKVKAMPPEYL
jgi:hypothetical protein